MQSMNEGARFKLVPASESMGIANAGAMQKIFDIAKVIEAAEYFQIRFAARVKALGLQQEFKEVMTEIDSFVDLVHNATSDSSDFWSGDVRDRAVSRLIHFQRTLSAAAINALTQRLSGQTIDFQFAIDGDSNLLQGIGANGALFDETTSAQINHVFSDWLTENNMTCRKGVIYMCDDEGKIIQDNEGHDKKVQPDSYRDLFMDKVKGSKGFATFLQEKTKGALKVNVVDRGAEKEEVSRTKKRG